MDYAKHYWSLVERGLLREDLRGYAEKHHIVPRCVDPASTDVVRLTPEEHYVAHQLLVRIYPGNYRLVFAAVRMTHDNSQHPRNNKYYGWLRRRWAEAFASAEWHREQSARITGQKRTEVARENMRASFTPERREIHRQVRIRLNVARTGTHLQKKRTPRTEEKLVNLRKPKSPEGRAAIKAAAMAREERRKAGIGYQVSNEKKQLRINRYKETVARRRATIAALSPEAGIRLEIARLEKSVARLEAQAAQARIDSEAA